MGGRSDRILTQADDYLNDCDSRGFRSLYQGRTGVASAPLKLGFELKVNGYFQAGASV